MAQKNQNKPAGASKKTTSADQAENESETLGPPVGAAASTSAQRSKVATPVVVGGDPFVDRVLPHLRKIIVTAVVAGVALSAFFGWRWWQQRGEAAATTELAGAFELLHRDVVAPPKPDDKDAPKPPETKRPTFPSNQARAEAAAAALAKAGDAAASARVLEANLLLQAGKIDQAEAVYRSVSTGTSLDAVLAREGLGFAAEAKAALAKEPAERQRALEAALAAFRAMQTDDKGERRDYALYHEARILSLLDQRAEAKAALEKALVVNPKSTLELDIQQRLAHLEATAAP